MTGPAGWKPALLTISLLVLVLGGAAAIVAPGGSVDAAGDPLEVLILGDSFSAGNGAKDYSFDLCRRSPNTWGELLAKSDALNIPGRPINVTNRACTGAISKDVVAGSLEHPGQLDRDIDDTSEQTIPYRGTQTDGPAAADAACRSLPVSAEDEYWTGIAVAFRAGSLKIECHHMVRSQLAEVRPNQDLVVMTLGGNDLGFSKIIQNCIVAHPPSVPTDPVRADAWMRTLCERDLAHAESLLNTTLQRDLTRVVGTVERKLNPPERKGNLGKILLLSYPGLISNDDYTFKGIEVGARLKRGAAQLRSIQQEVMNHFNRKGQPPCRSRVGVYAGKTAAAFDGHEPEAPVLTDGDANWWIYEILVGPSGADLDSYHPKAAGHAAEAEVAAAALAETDFRRCATATTHGERTTTTESPTTVPPATPLGVREFLSGFLQAWWRSDEAEVAKYASPEALDELGPPADWAEYDLKWTDACFAGSSGTGSCSVVLLADDGGRSEYSLRFHEEATPEGNLIYEIVPTDEKTASMSLLEPIFSESGQSCIADLNSDGSSRAVSRESMIATFDRELEDGSGPRDEVIGQAREDVMTAPSEARIERWECGNNTTGEPTGFAYTASIAGAEPTVLGVYLSPENPAVSRLRGAGVNAYEISAESWDALLIGG